MTTNWRCSHGWPQGNQCPDFEKIASMQAEIDELREKLAERAQEVAKVHAEKMSSWSVQQRIIDELRAKLAEYEGPRKYINVDDENALVLQEGKYHKWEDEDGVDWEWFGRDVDCDTCVDVALVRVDRLAELLTKLRELEPPDRYDLTQVYTPNCNRHPDAPHGVDEVASYYAGHPVCTCRSWKPGEAS